MSWFNLKQPVGTNYTVDPGDIINAKTALNQLGYYQMPSHRGIDDWTDDSMFNGIKAFQRDNGLKVDGLMRPGGPTEEAINRLLPDNGAGWEANGDGDNPPLADGADNDSSATSAPAYSNASAIRCRSTLAARFPPSTRRKAAKAIPTAQGRNTWVIGIMCERFPQP